MPRSDTTNNNGIWMIAGALALALLAGLTLLRRDPAPSEPAEEAAMSARAVPTPARAASSWANLAQQQGGNAGPATRSGSGGGGESAGNAGGGGADGQAARVQAGDRVPARGALPFPKRAVRAPREGGADAGGYGLGGVSAGRGDPETGASLSVGFNGSANAADQSPPLVSEGVQFNPTPGATPNGARLPPEARLAYSDLAGLNPQNGTVAFEVSAEAWDPDKPLRRTLLYLGAQNQWENGLEFGLSANHVGMVVHDQQGAEHTVGSTIDWAPGEWHKLAFSWGEDLMSIYIDGALVDQQPYSGAVSIPPNTMAWLGSTRNGNTTQQGTVLLRNFDAFGEILPPEQLATLHNPAPAAP